jgi:hypothetical protein
MHEPDKFPDNKIISEQRFTAQWIANISLICAAFTIIGMILALFSGKKLFFALSAIGIALAIWAIRWGSRIPDERVRVTGTLSVILNAVLFIVLMVIYLFVKEAGMAL